jgi:hypothetical protein
MGTERVNLENELAAVMNRLPNGVEMLVGALSSLTTEKQLNVLVDHMKGSK